jgi:Zn-dependent protease
MVLVAAAGPAMNIMLAVVAGLAFHTVGYLPTTVAYWLADNLKNALVLNVVLAAFNLFRVPPLERRTHLSWDSPKRRSGTSSPSAARVGRMAVGATRGLASKSD